MKQLILAVLLLTVALSAQTWVLAAQATPPVATRALEVKKTVWIESYASGMEKAHEEKRPVLLDFRADWCGPCRMMERDTFSDKDVLAALKPFVLIRVDVDKEADVAFEWKINAIPRVVILNVYGQVILDQMGYLPPEDFLPRVKDVSRFIDTKMAEGAQEVATTPPEDRLPSFEQELSTLGDDELTSIVTKLVALPTSKQRHAGLIIFKQHAERVRPILMRLLGDAHLAVRVGALEVLKSIGQVVPDYDPWASSEMRRSALDHRETRPVK